MDAKHEMERSFDFYQTFDPDLLTDENRKDYQEDVQQAADHYIKAKEKYLKLVTAGLQREKKGSGPIMSNFLGWVFQLFVVKKKNIF